jgi:hypothetical protein
MRQEGVVNPAYSCGSSFWILHHDAIEEVYDLSMSFWHQVKRQDIVLDVSVALGYAMQMLCADPHAHLVTAHPELWASDDEARFAAGLPERRPNGQALYIRPPAIIHVPWKKRPPTSSSEAPDDV